LNPASYYGTGSPVSGISLLVLHFLEFGVDHVIVLNEAHLRRILSQYFAYYHEDRTHLAFERNAPIPRPIEARDAGRVIAAPRVGGLHHRYSRVA